MLDLVYDDAPYHVLFYDGELHVRRTDRFDGWSTQPTAGGVSFFAYGVQGYLDLVPAAEASPDPRERPTNHPDARRRPVDRATPGRGLAAGRSDGVAGRYPRLRGCAESRDGRAPRPPESSTMTDPASSEPPPDALQPSTIADLLAATAVTVGAELRRAGRRRQVAACPPVSGAPASASGT